MTNREKLTKTNIYDTLLRCNRNFTGYGVRCILEIVDYNNFDRDKRCDYDCPKCIANWLNEEAK